MNGQYIDFPGRWQEAGSAVIRLGSHSPAERAESLPRLR